MISPVRNLTRLLSCVVLLASAVACTSAPPPSPKLLARCEQLYAFWSRYEQLPTFHHMGQKARAEWAIYNRRRGIYASGIEDLERMLKKRPVFVAARLKQRLREGSMIMRNKN